MSNLPNELIVEIFLYLNVKDALHFIATCKQIQLFKECKKIWVNLLEFEHPYLDKINSNCLWKNNDTCYNIFKKIYTITNKSHQNYMAVFIPINIHLMICLSFIKL